MKKLTSVIGILILLLIQYCFSGCSVISRNNEGNIENSIESGMKTIDLSQHYKIIENIEDTQTSYTFMVYDYNGNIVLEESTTRMPNIRYVNDEALEILTSHGSPATLCRYYDIRNNILSQEFWNPSFVDGNTIVYMDYNENRNPEMLLIIRNIFDNNKLYKEISRDFSPVAVGCLAIVNVKFVNSSTIELEYFEGEDFISTTEVIEL